MVVSRSDNRHRVMRDTRYQGLYMQNYRSAVRTAAVPLSTRVLWSRRGPLPTRIPRLL